MWNSLHAESAHCYLSEQVLSWFSSCARSHRVAFEQLTSELIFL